ncbi:MAG: hypothetical protein ABIF17_01005 [Patescibacteria group bacterium]
MKNLDRVLDLIKKTGDKAIIVPVSGIWDSDPYVIVPIDQYKQIVSVKVNYAEMTEEEILNRVNREISLWKQSQRELGFNPDIDMIHDVNNFKKPFDIDDIDDIDEDENIISDNNSYDYEEVPPPPDLHLKNNSLPIIDMSFKDSDSEIIRDIKNSHANESDFLVEPIE